MGSRRGGFVYKARRTRRFPFRTVVVLLVVAAGLALLRQSLMDRRAAAPVPPPRASAPARPPRAGTAAGQKARPAPEKAAPPAPAAAGYGPGSETVEPPRRPPGPARAALVLDDTGSSLGLVLQAVEQLPTHVTFAVIPHLKDSEASARALHERGFPVILHAPMEPEDGGRWKPVRGELDVGMHPEEVARVLAEALAAVPHAEGANNHMGSRATRDGALMGAAMTFFKGRGLYFLDSRTTPGTVAYAEAQRAGVPCAQRAVFLDDVDEPGAIMVQLDVLGERALKEGEAVAIGHLRPNTVRVLAQRLPHWEGRGVRFVPLREVVR